MLIREPIAAGTFYPSAPLELKEMIEGFLKEANVELPFSPRALIVPHAGYVYSGLVAAYAYKSIQGKKYSRVVLLGPSHHFAFEGLTASSADFWQTPLGKVKTLKKEDFPYLQGNVDVQEDASIHQPEHCLEVQLPFLQIVLKDFRIFPLLMGDIFPKKAAGLLSPLLDNETLLIVSSDLSHYLSYNEAKKADQVTIGAILQEDPINFQEKGEACGKMPIATLMYIAQEKHWQPHLLKALNSGDITGDLSRVVGYASFAYSSED